MSDKWKGLERIAENGNFGMTNADQHLAILAREFGPLLEAAELLMKKLNTGSRENLRKQLEKFK